MVGTGRACGAVVLALAAGCGPRAPAGLAGSSTAPRPAGVTDLAPPVRPSERRARWEAYERVRTWPPVGQPFPSTGHVPPRYLGVPHVEPSRRELYLQLVPGATVPSGFAVTMVHSERDTGRDGPIYAAQKQGDGTWLYTVASPRGQLLAQGPLPGCARCHADAPADGLFGLPVRGTTAPSPE